MTESETRVLIKALLVIAVPVRRHFMIYSSLVELPVSEPVCVSSYHLSTCGGDPAFHPALQFQPRVSSFSSCTILLMFHYSRLSFF